MELDLQIASTKPQSVEVRASIYQQAAAVAAPLQKLLPVADHLDVDAAAIQRKQFTFTLPSVRSAATLEVRFEARGGGDAPWVPAGASQLAIYPENQLDLFQTLFAPGTANGAPQIVVLGESPRLKAVLAEIKVPFAQNENPPAQPGAICVAECKADAARALIDATPRDARLLLFTADSPLPAGVYWTEVGGRLIAKITTPVLADFDQCPDRQLLLLALLQKSLRQDSELP